MLVLFFKKIRIIKNTCNTSIFGVLGFLDVTQFDSFNNYKVRSDHKCFHGCIENTFKNKLNTYLNKNIMYGR